MYKIFFSKFKNIIFARSKKGDGVRQNRLN